MGSVADEDPTDGGGHHAAVSPPAPPPGPDGDDGESDGRDDSEEGDNDTDDDYEGYNFDLYEHNFMQRSSDEE